MIGLTHYDDRKEKWQSHEITIGDSGFFNAEFGIYSHDPFDITGYGRTKDEAIEDFKNKFKYVMRELKAFETMLLDTDMITDNIIEVDGRGVPITSIKE